MSQLDVRELRNIVSGQFTPRPAVYWADFLLSVSIGYGAAVLYFKAPLPPSVFVLCYLVAGFALYRVSIFIHEIVHFRQDQMRGFHYTWNLLAGVPMLTPSWFYESHIAHHNTREYGTDTDGEYLPLGHGKIGNIALFFAQVFAQPVIVVTRFALLTPISYLHPRLRQWVLVHMSSFVINWRYRRKLPERMPVSWTVFEALCSVRAMLIFVAVAVGLEPWTSIPKLYALAVLILGLNYVRTLAAHRYLGDGASMSHTAQLFDSVDIIGSPVSTELICPLGLRYHALHHLFPSIPYHNLPAAHRQLMNDLPEDSPYRQVVYPSLWSVLKEVLDNTRRRNDKSEADDRSITMAAGQADDKF